MVYHYSEHRAVLSNSSYSYDIMP